ncbi:two-component sensor histidine kinase [Paenibacillus agaridevorans]|uniref:histidine kinase n=1 Tax=Paenibacillus agaridevorans TaxID=171404 RepID=A0A2R5F0V8_9BACL|nr:sensor histidine kinase [Paenibacillus agaridevorans]GBG11018.1 two-component sensor histidine kinase [Paenibacillus agaridevorans]
MKAFYSNLRIKYKLVGLISLMMLVIGLATYFVMRFTFKAYDDEIYRQSASALNSASLGVEKELRDMEKLTFTIATDGSIQRYMDVIKQGGSDYDNFLVAISLQERLLSIGGFAKYVLSFHLIDVYLREYKHGANANMLSAARIEEVIAETERNTGGISYIFPENGDGALIAGRQIRQVRNLELDILGTLAVRLDLARLFRDLAGPVNQGDGMFAILAGDGQSVYPTNPSIDVSALNVSHGEGSGYEVREVNGERFFITYVPSSYMDWTYLNIQPYDAIFRKTETAKQSVFVIYLIVFLLVLLAALWFSRSVTSPIERLSDRMKRVQMGHFEYALLPGEREPAMDEAGLLHRNFRIMVERINELINENYVKQLAIKDTEFKALQAQINPHFLYNTLESINWSAKAVGHKQISVMVESLGYLLRSSISGKEPLVPLQEEMATIGHYISIQAIRFEERLDFRSHIPARLNDCLVPKLSVQPIVENAIQYALEPMIDTCVITVEAEESGGIMRLIISDNGPGIQHDVLARLDSGELVPRGTGIGLRNIDERIRLLFGEGYGLEVGDNKGGGTRITLVLPVEMRDPHV